MKLRHAAIAALIVAVAIVCWPRPESVSTKQIETAKVENRHQLEHAGARRDSTAAGVKRTKATRDVAASKNAIARDALAEIPVLPLPAVTALAAADEQLHADSLHIEALNADRAALIEQRDLERVRADLAEAELEAERARKPRLGFKAGVATTLAVLAGLALLLK